ncbi:MAG: hypothetical protein CSA66_04000, partial [Proteobacteria bacterium]
YLYYPLGGGRVSTWKVYRNLYITFVLIGLWHGADWTYVVYGLLHATAMVINRYLRKRREARGVQLRLSWWGVAWRVSLTLHFVMFARILFRAGSYVHDPAVDPFTKVGDVMAALGSGSYGDVTIMTPGLWALLLGTYLWHWTPRRWTEATFGWYRRMPLLAQGLTLGLGILAFTEMAAGRPLPFQYFKF